MANFWHKIWLVFQREYLVRVKNKTFWLITFLAPIGILALGSIPVLIGIFSNETQNIAILDQSSFSLSSSLQNTGKTTFKVEKAALDDLKNSYQNKGFTAILVIPNFDLNQNPTLSYFSKNPIGLETKTQIVTQINQKLVSLRLESAKLDLNFASFLQQSVVLDSKILSAEGEKTGSSTIGTGIGYFSGFVIYIVLLVYGSLVMQGVLEEKNSRIVEILLSSIKPFELMLGKILGIALVGLTQFVIWIGLALTGGIIFTILLTPVLSKNITPEMMQSYSKNSSNISNIQSLSSPANTSEISILNEEAKNINFNLIFVCFLIYFLGGYLLYASLFAAIGSAVNSEKEASGLMIPVMMPIIISFTMLFTVTQNPNGNLAVWLSIIPFTSPIIMLSRLPFGVPWWELVASILVLFTTFIATSYLAGKIYRIGILMYGVKPKIQDLWRWMIS
jgi:ABC-2 type transport system permease protein